MLTRISQHISAATSCTKQPCAPADRTGLEQRHHMEKKGFNVFTAILGHTWHLPVTASLGAVSLLCRASSTTQKSRPSPCKASSRATAGPVRTNARLCRWTCCGGRRYDRGCCRRPLAPVSCSSLSREGPLTRGVWGIARGGLWILHIRIQVRCVADS